MGCDIHMYIEYRKESSEHWKHFGDRINPGRNYLIFGILSKGVRTDPAFALEPKGMPEDAGYASRDANQCFIAEGEGYTSIETAKRWVDEGSSTWIKDHNGNPTWVTNPDWHSHSWLSAAEFEKAMTFYRESYPAENEPEYEVILTILKRFVELGFQSRVVFWFDN